MKDDIFEAKGTVSFASDGPIRTTKTGKDIYKVTIEGMDYESWDSGWAAKVGEEGSWKYKVDEFKGNKSRMLLDLKWQGARPRQARPAATEFNQGEKMIALLTDIRNLLAAKSESLDIYSE